MPARDRSRSGPSGWAAYNRARSALCCGVRRRPAAAAPGVSLPSMPPASADGGVSGDLSFSPMAVARAGDIAIPMAIAGAADVESAVVSGASSVAPMATAGGGSVTPDAGAIDGESAGASGASSAAAPVSAIGRPTEPMQGGNVSSSDIVQRLRSALREELRVYASRPRVDVGVQVGAPMGHVRHAAVGEHVTGEPMLWRGIFDVP